MQIPDFLEFCIFQVWDHNKLFCFQQQPLSLSFSIDYILNPSNMIQLLFKHLQSALFVHFSSFSDDSHILLIVLPLMLLGDGEYHLNLILIRQKSMIATVYIIGKNMFNLVKLKFKFFIGLLTLL